MEQYKLLDKVKQFDLIQAFHESVVLEIDHIPKPRNIAKAKYRIVQDGKYFFKYILKERILLRLHK